MALRECLQRRDRVVLDLRLQVFLDVLASDGDGGRRAEVRLRRHGREVGRLHEPEARGGGARSVRRHVDDHRQRRGEHALVDLAHRLGQAARRVEQEDDVVVALLLSLLDPVGDVVGRDRVDVVLELDGEDAGAFFVELSSGDRRDGENREKRDREDEGRVQPTHGVLSRA